MHQDRLRKADRITANENDVTTTKTSYFKAFSPPNELGLITRYKVSRRRHINLLLQQKKKKSMGKKKKDSMALERVYRCAVNTQRLIYGHCLTRGCARCSLNYGRCSSHFTKTCRSLINRFSVHLIFTRCCCPFLSLLRAL